MQCPTCQADNPPKAQKCSQCGARLARRRNGPQAGESAIQSWIDSSNALARTAYRCALLALVPFLGLVLGPAALIMGLIGRLREKANPSEGGAGLAMAAMVLGGITLVTNWTGLYFLLHGW
jgi:hypothetical protein